MTQLGLKEIHAKVLDIAKEFDRICTKYSIPYYMLGGTMLGAIRHKGFIPWDDDMDFGVPIEYYDQLINLLEKELSYPYRCCTYKTSPAVIDNFLKIEDTTTVIDDITCYLPLNSKLGVNIDVFPLNPCKRDDSNLKKIQRRRFLLGGFMRSKSKPNSKMREFVKCLLRFFAGGKPIYVQQSVDKIIHNVSVGDCLGNLLGRWGEKEIVPHEWYGQGVRYEFEGEYFQGIANYDAYLSQLYGDYMELPKEKYRLPHVENIFMRDQIQDSI